MKYYLPFILLLLQFSILCYKSNIGYKVQFLVVFLVIVDF